MTQQTKAAQQTRKQVRSFVVIWTFITMIMGLATFIAIYFAYQPTVSAAEPDAVSNAGDAPVVVIASPTAAPTTEAITVAMASNASDEQPQSEMVQFQAPTNTPSGATQDQETQSQTQQNTQQSQPIVLVTNTPSGMEQQQQQPAQPTEPEQPAFVPPDEDLTFKPGIQVKVANDLNVDVIDGDLRTVQGLNMNWVKVQVRWEIIEPQRGQYDWSSLDVMMERLLFFQIRPMLSIVTAPDWARESGVNLEEHGPPADYGEYVNFVRTLLNRYEGQVYGVEVWNEQNISREWTSTRGLSARDYVNLLSQTYNMVQQTSPGTIVISGALAPTGVDDGIGAIDDFRYMQQMIDAGMLNVTDCVGTHHNGYNIGPDVRFDNVPNDPTAIFRGPFDNPHHSWSFRSTMEGYIQRIRAAGSDKRLCVTEFGWPVSEDIGAYPRGFEFAADNTLQEQAEFLVDALDYMESSGDFWLVFVWNLNYGPQAGWNPDDDNVPYSLIGPGFNFRPAYDAVRDWVADFKARTGQQ